MSEKIVVPTLGESITEASVSKWLKSVGESVNSDENKEASSEDSQKLEDEETKDNDVDQSIESVPFISDPVKKKRSRSSK